MKKVLVTLTAIGVLAVPAGAAFADDDTTDPTTPATTCVEPVRDRDRIHDRVIDQEGVAVQDRERLRLHDGTCDRDCTGDQERQGQMGGAGDGFGYGRDNS